MGLFRFRKTAESEPLGTSISWTAKLKFSALIRSNSQHGTKEPIASSPIHVNCQPASMLRRADTTSTLSHSSTQPSIAGSRSPSELFCASPTDTSFTASSLHRTPSIYSHRSYNIRRDSIKGRPPILPRSSHADVPPPLPQAVSEDGLVLTATVCLPCGYYDIGYSNIGVVSLSDRHSSGAVHTRRLHLQTRYTAGEDCPTTKSQRTTQANLINDSKNHNRSESTRKVATQANVNQFLINT